MRLSQLHIKAGELPFVAGKVSETKCFSKSASTVWISVFTVIVNHFCKPLNNSALSLSVPAILLVQTYKACCILWSISIHEVSRHEAKEELRLGFQDTAHFQNLYPLVPHHLLPPEVFQSLCWPCKMSWAKWACEYSSLVLWGKITSVVDLGSYSCAVIKPSLF